MVFFMPLGRIKKYANLQRDAHSVRDIHRFRLNYQYRPWYAITRDQKVCTVLATTQFCKESESYNYHFLLNRMKLLNTNFYLM